MKLVSSDFSFQLELEESKVNLLIIENPIIFSKIILELLKQSEGNEGRFVLSQEGKVLKIEDNIFCIINPLELDFNQKNIITKLYSRLKEEIINTELLLENNSIYADIFQYIQKVIDTISYPLTYKADMEPNALFKLLNVKFEEVQESLVERIIDYIKIMQQILGKKIVVLVNIKAYLSINELEQLYREAAYQKLNLIILESHLSSSLNNEVRYIIDKDLCEIY
ncbi:type II-A CRISPR-associated protein Csn2 [Anaerosacchariphilus polymeriproducens]|uniref:Type II-A CRISPR-associated protein Csn2 n=1 Tax=Anaerosacchariphilus polymeriproducens TaxID=1812858 RepID=A0A371ART7_9FIRM|nr:type II-A CRISPR-associated protein Csn2 [Anaerosacchariphilus polymeriproducens]RDU22252.1 type II-A CRISPR-associated protein Csn2 [Anaerosacchariphilus polymeriproducens]